MALKKADLIKILVEQYGYEKDDLKFDADGKPYTNAKLQGLINQEEQDAKELEINKNRVVAKETGIKDTDKISVMSGSMGTVIYRSDISRKLWKFTRFGQMEKIPYEELLAMHNRYPSYFRDGWIVVLDAQVQDEFGLTKMYENILTPENIDTIFNKQIDELTVFVENLPDGMKNAFINKAQELYDKEELESTKVIKLIEKKFGFRLEDNAPVSDVALEGNLGRENIIYVDKRK